MFQPRHRNGVKSPSQDLPEDMLLSLFQRQKPARGLTLMKDTTGKVEHLCETLTTLNHFINPKKSQPWGKVKPFANCKHSKELRWCLQNLRDSLKKCLWFSRSTHFSFTWGRFTLAGFLIKFGDHKSYLFSSNNKTWDTNLSPPANRLSAPRLPQRYKRPGDLQWNL